MCVTVNNILVGYSSARVVPAGNTDLSRILPTCVTEMCMLHATHPRVVGYTSLASLEGAVMDLGADTLRLAPLEYRENKKQGGGKKVFFPAPFSFEPYSISIKWKSDPQNEFKPNEDDPFGWSRPQGTPLGPNLQQKLGPILFILI